MDWLGERSARRNRDGDETGGPHRHRRRRRRQLLVDAGLAVSEVRNGSYSATGAAFVQCAAEKRGEPKEESDARQQEKQKVVNEPVVDEDLAI